ncbi:Smr domain-containing protein [Rhynchospora pubera]|uniref:Smr domain-containing protein n=1 Tax=Rhynchospora pubera TaxID=906938 RepID=A0AAV8AHB6_9POAL|nr:Smr domain-containing protein [Rhynchospora pubera]KAJ4814245.1 Smr domain-containing protein [Rhynchospora pubera]
MQRPKIQNTSGWAAFDRRHRPQNQKVNAASSDPFPPISGIAHGGPTSSLSKTSPPRTKSYSSILRPCNLLEDSVKLLKDANNWADHDLIEDVLKGVNNDLNMASQILKSMISNNCKDGETTISGEESRSNVQKNEGLMKEAKPDKNKSVLDGNHGISSTSGENSASLNGMANGSIFSVPVEPEWEECDDDYYNYRKDALKVMRAASNHSRAASNAFLRGDHNSARWLSQQAREEWAEAEKLNGKAAKEILRVKNANNDMSKLDLHGLHASEAVHAMEEHLMKIEDSDRMKSGPDFKDVSSTHPRQNILHVITGTGTHSKGQASLPAAVKSFLIEKGYRFEEARPGVFDVQPKFRYKIETRTETNECNSSL